MTVPNSPPPEGLTTRIRWKRVIDGDTIEVVLRSGRLARVRIAGFDAPEARSVDGIAATHALTGLLETTADKPLRLYIPAPEDKDKNGTLDLDELLSILSFERVCAYLFAGTIRVDLWMIEHGHVKA